jgi:hypothetical protein
MYQEDVAVNAAAPWRAPSIVKHIGSGGKNRCAEGRGLSVYHAVYMLLRGEARELLPGPEYRAPKKDGNI